jgi:hypothetical protein
MYGISRTVDALDLATEPSYAHVRKSYHMTVFRDYYEGRGDMEKIYEYAKQFFPMSFRPSKEK